MSLRIEKTSQTSLLHEDIRDLRGTLQDVVTSMVRINTMLEIIADKLEKHTERTDKVERAVDHIQELPSLVGKLQKQMDQALLPIRSIKFLVKVAGGIGVIAGMVLAILQLMGRL